MCLLLLLQQLLSNILLLPLLWLLLQLGRLVMRQLLL
jgi:hypothetical protein